MLRGGDNRYRKALSIYGPSPEETEEIIRAGIEDFVRRKQAV